MVDPDSGGPPHHHPHHPQLAVLGKASVKEANVVASHLRKATKIFKIFSKVPTYTVIAY
jgi:hypothetical protein